MTEENKKPIILRYLPAFLIFAAIIAAAVFGIYSVGETTQREGLSVAEKSIRRAVITCYAEEGRYPESIEYLTENYGLNISDEYEVFYDIFADNIMPEITVVRKQVQK